MKRVIDRSDARDEGPLSSSTLSRRRQLFTSDSEAKEIVSCGNRGSVLSKGERRKEKKSGTLDAVWPR